MRLVIDANPFFAGFLRDAASRRIILSENVVLCSPAWLKEEFTRNEASLRKKFPSPAVFEETRDILLSFIALVPPREYNHTLDEALTLAKHAKDAPYFALALHLQCPLWSNEASFKKQPIIKVFSTADLIKEL